MKPLSRKIAVGLVITATALLVQCLCLYALGARLNVTRSIPLGLYWSSTKPAEKGDYVLVCPPQVGVMAEGLQRGYLAAGFCPGGYGYLMKQVVGMANDAVSIRDQGVSVNGVLLPFSAPLARDGAGRPLPRFQAADFVIGNSEVLLMSGTSPTSFDGRYFGPLNRSQIQSVIVPVLTWPGR
jgi:conjugative transfer signal peptidase TraF